MQLHSMEVSHMLEQNSGAGLRSIFLEHRWLVLRYAVAVALLFGVGLELLHIAVAGLGIDKVQANLALAPVMGYLGYLANRFFVFYRREAKLGESGPRWFGFRLACFIVAQATFIFLVTFFGMHYMDARLVISGVLGPVVTVTTLVAAHFWIFSEQTDNQ